MLGLCVPDLFELFREIILTRDLYYISFLRLPFTLLRRFTETVIYFLVSLQQMRNMRIEFITNCHSAARRAHNFVYIIRRRRWKVIDTQHEQQDRHQWIDDIIRVWLFIALR